MSTYDDNAQSERKALYPVTSDAPEGLRCLSVQIPDSDEAMAMLFGALSTLTRWRNYQRDAAHKAREWTQAWLTAIKASYPIQECGVAIEFMQDDCGLYFREIGATEWEPIYDGLYCLQSDGAKQLIDDYIGDYIDQLIEDGVLGRPGQGSPQGELAQDECKTFHVSLEGRDSWHCPVPVASNYTVTIRNLTGGWSDGTPAWYCPDGARYLLGACSEDLHSHQETDPTQDAWHMALIAHLGDDYYDLSEPLTVPTGHNLDEFYIQANDGTLTDNQGSVEFDVDICNAGWCYFVDLTGVLPSWLTVIYGAHGSGGIVGEQGYVYRADTQGEAYGTACGIKITMPTEGRINYVAITATWGAPDAYNDTRGIRNRYSYANDYENLGGGYTGEQTKETSPNHTFAADDELDYIMGAGWSGGAPPVYCSITATALMLRGTGVNPFGSNNC